MAQTGVDGAARDQARRAAESEAADRAARVDAPRTVLGSEKLKALGPFPAEAGCFIIRQTVVDTVLPRKLRWVSGRLARYRGRCVGHEGLNYILKDLEAGFLSRGLVTTRAGLPEQDLSKGVLHVAVVPGVVAKVVGGTAKTRRSWRMAAPIHVGDLVSLRALEQGADQIKRVQGADIKADMAPGAKPGDTILELTAKAPEMLSGSASVNSFAGPTVGTWQGSANLTAQDILGLNETLSGWYNSRTDNPSVPADSTSTGASFSIPYGWWTFGTSVSSNHYSQEIVDSQGAARDISTNTLQTVAVTAEDVIHRDRTSKTSLTLQFQRRWGRSYVYDFGAPSVGYVEIGLQHDDLSDVQLTLNDKRNFGQIKLTSALSWRQGVSLFGVTTDLSGDKALPTSYGIAVLDEALQAPISGNWGYGAAFRAQMADKPVVGADLFTVGGPYTVRGYDSDHAVADRDGWYLRQEINYRLSRIFQPYGFVDTGAAPSNWRWPVGIGLGLRASWQGFNLDGFAAEPLRTLPGVPQRMKFGLTAGWGF